MCLSVVAKVTQLKGSEAIVELGNVSKEIELPQPFQNMGAKMINQVASKTSDVVGDGTTTATVLAEAIYAEGLKYVAAGVNPVAIQRGINKAAQVAIDHIQSMSKKVKGHDDIAKVIFRMILQREGFPIE